MKESKDQKYYRKHRREVYKKNKKWREKNSEKVKIYRKRFNGKHKKEISRERKQYYQLNKEKIKNRNKERIERIKYTKEYRFQRNQIDRRRHYRKRGLGGFHTLEEWEKLKDRYNHRCIMCGIQEPFTNQFRFWLTEDHIISSTKWKIWIGKYPKIKHQWNDIENIQPLCGNCNSSKGDRIYFDSSKSRN